MQHKIEIDHNVLPEEVIYVREEERSATSLELWQSCIRQALCVVTARDENGHIRGIGFLVGNRRHGEIVDLVVHSTARQNGLGGEIFDKLVSYAKEMKVAYLGLTYDTRHPWLKDFYERHGFRVVNFAMWEKESLLALGEQEPS